MRFTVATYNIHKGFTQLNRRMVIHELRERLHGLAADEHNFLHPTEPPQVPYLWTKLSGSEGPYVAVSDYMHAVQDQIRPYVPGDFVTLGADGRLEEQLDPALLARLIDARSSEDVTEVLADTVARTRTW